MSDYLDKYSPFDDKEDSPPPKPVTKSDPVPIKSDPSGSPTEEELRALEERVNLLEHSVNAQEQTLGSQTFSEPAPNWPKCYPVVHFVIEDVPEHLRGFVKESFFCWFCMAITFAANFIGCLSLLSDSESVTSPGSKIALSALYLFIVVPLALDLDNLSIYRALCTNIATFTYIKIFISLAFTILFESILALGMDSSGSVGMITMFNLFTNKCIGLGIWALLTTAAFIFTIICHCILIIKLWRYYRGSQEGANMETDVKRGVAEFVIDKLT